MVSRIDCNSVYRFAELSYKLLWINKAYKLLKSIGLNTLTTVSLEVL